MRIDLYGKNFNWITRRDASNAGDAITLESDLGGPGNYYIATLDPWTWIAKLTTAIIR